MTTVPITVNRMQVNTGDTHTARHTTYK